ncbi:hypothetical protein NPIL_29001 [Nephila pilipes]|uniref:Uncharacterized protein n=1 Tax=Nephila pilipes TaxID=299642 RepID=A0A8X6MUI8_NEPPI|nr:hypothetical protein NPIL_29001 [Nephila pilipes]
MELPFQNTFKRRFGDTTAFGYVSNYSSLNTLSEKRKTFQVDTYQDEWTSRVTFVHSFELENGSNGGVLGVNYCSIRIDFQPVKCGDT